MSENLNWIPQGPPPGMEQVWLCIGLDKTTKTVVVLGFVPGEKAEAERQMNERSARAKAELNVDVCAVFELMRAEAGQLGNEVKEFFVANGVPDEHADEQVRALFKSMSEQMRESRKGRPGGPKRRL
jgi:hypothetical protein